MSMVGNHDNRNLAGVWQAVDPVQQGSDLRIGMADGFAGFGGARAVAVARVVDAFEVQRHQARPGCGRFGQPVQYLVDPGPVGNGGIERSPAAGTNTADIGLGADEVVGRGAHAGFLGGHPGRFGLVPAPVFDGRPVP